MKITLLLFALFFSVSILTHGAQVDTLNIPSHIMKKEYKAAVVLPASYAKDKLFYPVIYLLHGGFEHFDAWLKKTPDKLLLHKIADQYGVIIVLPEGELFSFFIDSPENRESQFETYVTKEVVKGIDSTYRTVKNSSGRIVCGASMGGFGAIYLSTRNPELFCAAGSISGAMDLDVTHYNLPPENVKTLKTEMEKSLGEEGSNAAFYFDNSPINMMHGIKSNHVKLILDCGVDDILLETNREFNRRLLYHKVPHEYTERPGGHTWNYFEKALLYQMHFFSNILKDNGVMIN
jgi:putative tributyrin esterase